MTGNAGDRQVGASSVGAPGAQRPSEERRYSLHANLIGLVAACLVPVAVIAAGLVVTNYVLQRDRIYRDTVLSARYLVAELDRELTAIESGLRVLETSPELVAGDLAAFHKHARQVLTGQIVSNYVLTDRQGRQLLNTIVPFGTPLPSAGRPIHLKRVFDSGETVLTDLFTGSVTRAPIVAMGIPVYRGDEIAYSLSIGIAPERIEPILQRTRLPEGWVASIMDSSGTIIARTRDPQRFVGQKAVDAIVQALASGQEETIETTTVEGVPVVSSISHSRVSRWSVGVGAPKATLEAQLVRLIGWVLAGMAAAVAVGLWLARRLARRVTTAVRGLNDAALALGSGDPVELPRTRLIEADAVGHAIVQAAQILESTRYLAQHDVLTGLCNRALFDEMLRRYLAAAQRTHGSLALLAVDLDGFKAVNDQLGHAAGDTVLKAVAERINETIRASDVAARMGGDEFAVLLGESNLDSAHQLAERLVSELSKPYGDALPRVSASVGIAMFPGHGADPASLLEHADRALYEAKRLGGRRVVVAR